MNRIGQNIINEINRTKKTFFSKEEIVELVKNTTSLDEDKVVELNGLTLNTNTREVIVGKKVTKLQKSLFNLLYFLAEHKNEAQRRNVLMRDVWGNDIIAVDKTLDVHIHSLRKVVGKDRIITEKKFGYMLVD